MYMLQNNKPQKTKLNIWTSRNMRLFHFIDSSFQNDKSLTYILCFYSTYKVPFLLRRRQHFSTNIDKLINLQEKRITEKGLNIEKVVQLIKGK